MEFFASDNVKNVDNADDDQQERLGMKFEDFVDDVEKTFCGT